MRKFMLMLPLLIGGCYKTNLVDLQDGGSPGNVERVWSHSLILGLIPITEVDVTRACGEKGAYAISTRQNFWNLLLAGVTSGIYTPTVAKITCRE